MDDPKKGRGRPIEKNPRRHITARIKTENWEELNRRKGPKRGFGFLLDELIENAWRPTIKEKLTVPEPEEDGPVYQSEEYYD